ncbi:mycofactocin biosynthesis chaperone MftB [Streptomyces sp. NBC_00448]|uniref:mycofactocin biosynthesis chaperone MftB n=1 Tax=Streptomyces sp. NBC_00448 TaxID=2903652 RepID=UPI002E1E7236|nr:mycofactocin biosynthesis chaperone MftB [Streptomyces sp. NBC_00448]
MPVEFDIERAWTLHPQVSVRPEPFGALLYHFGTRRLSFLKDPELLSVVRELDAQPSARRACEAVAGERLPAFTAALSTLARTRMIVERHAASTETTGDAPRVPPAAPGREDRRLP